MTGRARAAAATPRESSFLEGWTVAKRGTDIARAVELPHDAMIGETRSPDAGTGNHGGYFPGGAYRYEKTWKVPADAADRLMSLRFEGVYGRTVVRVNGAVAAEWDSGYREVSVPLSPFITPGEDALIDVEVDNTRTPNSRWYTGSGIYRPVSLISVPHTHIAEDGIHVVTRDARPEWAIADVSVAVENPSQTGATAVLALRDAGGIVAEARSAIVAGAAFATIEVPRPRLWSAEEPSLYELSVQVVAEDGTVLDGATERIGLRTISVDPRHGLRINGRRVTLRGACVHHDNGVLGAATHTDAERRRARVLKENGFNAVRSSHHPLSRAFIEACDELGLYVMDELTDVWFQAKTAFDSAEAFEELWRDDAIAMVAKDRNRPSVIMYSIGNEISETATPRGVETTAEIAEFFAAADPDRPSTIAMNFMLNMLASLGGSAFHPEKDLDNAGRGSKEGKPKKRSAATSTAVNAVAATIGSVLQQVSRLPRADRYTRDSLSRVDVAGYNYAFLRYRADRKRYPDRIILGTESMPGDIAKIWRLVESVPGVIGDFMWTGWDYLGESGIGVWAYADGVGGMNAPYPALLAGPGAIDILGLPGAPALLARAVWGELEAPAIAVRPLDRSGDRVRVTPWRTSDALESWSWPGHEGTAAQVEVYSADDEVELLLDGRSLGKKRAGAAAGFVARFDVPYGAGRLRAVGYRNGSPGASAELRSAGKPSLTLRPEHITDGDRLRYVWVELADADGIVCVAAEDTVTVQVSGGRLAGFGSAAPAPTGSYVDDVHDTYYGRALAVVQVDGVADEVIVTARSIRHGEAEVRIPV